MYTLKEKQPFQEYLIENGCFFRISAVKKILGKDDRLDYSDNYLICLGIYGKVVDEVCPILPILYIVL